MLKSFFIIACIFCSTQLFSQEKDTTFKLCEQSKTYPYYYHELSYQGGFWEIKQHYISKYPTLTFQKLKNNTGIITIQFKVNCEGQTGDFTILQCDLNYQPMSLNKEITTHFLNETKKLKNWIPGKDEEGNNVNSHKFFSFRIKDGVLLEILPK